MSSIKEPFSLIAVKAARVNSENIRRASSTNNSQDFDHPLSNEVSNHSAQSFSLHHLHVVHGSSEGEVSSIWLRSW